MAGATVTPSFCSIVMAARRPMLSRAERRLTLRERWMPRGFPQSAAGGQTAAMSDEWRNMEDFAEGIDTNRLPRTEALAGGSITVELADGGTLTIDFDLDTAAWTATGVAWAGGGTDTYEAVEIGVGAFWVDLTLAERRVETLTLAISPP